MARRSETFLIDLKLDFDFADGVPEDPETVRAHVSRHLEALGSALVGSSRVCGVEATVARIGSDPVTEAEDEAEDEDE
jgi:hypothetical protein